MSFETVMNLVEIQSEIYHFVIPDLIRNPSPKRK